MRPKSSPSTTVCHTSSAVVSTALLFDGCGLGFSAMVASLAGSLAGSVSSIVSVITARAWPFSMTTSPLALRSLGAGSIVTTIPTLSIGLRLSRSLFARRTHPSVVRPPMEFGSLVPWMPMPRCGVSRRTNQSP